MCKRCIGNATKIYWTDGGISVKSFNLPCNSWACEECAARKAVILGNRVKAGFAGERIRFATFTDPGKGTLCQRLQNLKSSWNRLRLALSRKYGLTKFFWVLEFGGDRGRPHLHCLLNCYIPQRQLSELARKAGFGAIVDIREVKDGGGFGYVFKYLSKDCGLKAGASALKAIGGRRFGLSRNIPPLAKSATPSAVVAISGSVCSVATLQAHSNSVAAVLGQSFEQLPQSGNMAACKVSTPHQRWTAPVEKSLFASDFQSWERLMIYGGGRWSSSGSKWAQNSFAKLSENDIFNLGGGATPLASALHHN